MAIENVMYRTLLAICGSAEMLLNDGRPYKIACDGFLSIVPRFLVYMKERRDREQMKNKKIQCERRKDIQAKKKHQPSFDTNL